MRPGEYRDQPQKTLLRAAEKELFDEIAMELGVTPSELTRQLILKLIIEQRPLAAEKFGVRLHRGLVLA